MNWLTQALRRVLPAFTVDDVLNAENEDALIEHRKVLNELTTATAEQRGTSQKLRATLKEASLRSSTFGDLEHHIRKDVRRVRKPIQ